MDRRPSHLSVPGRVIYPRFPGFNLSADKFARFARPNATGLSGLLWYGAENGDACVYSPSGAFAPKVGGYAPGEDEINGCIRWGSNVYRTADGKWALVVDSAAPACNPFEAWHYEADPESGEGATVKVYDGWGWWELTIPSTYYFGDAARRRCSLVPRGTLLNADHATDRENPPEVKLEWDAYRRVEKASDESGPGGLYRNEDGDEVAVGNPVWESEEPALSRLVGVRLTDGWLRYLADGRDTVNLSGARPMFAYGGIYYVAHETPLPKHDIRFMPCTADGEYLDPDEGYSPFDAEWHGWMTAVTPKAVAYAFDIPTVAACAEEEV